MIRIEVNLSSGLRLIHINFPVLTTQNHRIVGVGRDLCGSSSPTLLLKQVHLQQAAQDLVQAGLEYLQRRRLHNLPGQPVPVLHHPQREEVLPYVQLELPVPQFVPIAPCPVNCISCNRFVQVTCNKFTEEIQDWLLKTNKNSRNVSVAFLSWQVALLKYHTITQLSSNQRVIKRQWSWPRYSLSRVRSNAWDHKCPGRSSAHGTWMCAASEAPGPALPCCGCCSSASPCPANRCRGHRLHGERWLCPTSGSRRFGLFSENSAWRRFSWEALSVLLLSEDWKFPCCGY